MHQEEPVFLYDQSMALTANGAGRFDVAVHDWWSIANVPNGGYLTAILGQACVQIGHHPDLTNLSAYFLAPAKPGPARVEVETLRVGRGSSCYQARLLQNDAELVRALVLCGDFDRMEGHDWHLEPAPDYPDPDACVQLSSDLSVKPKIHDNLWARLLPEHVGFFEGKPSGKAEHGGWLRFADGREPTLNSLPFFADAIPPTSFSLLGRIGWTPTLELGVQLRARPKPGWIQIRMRTHHMNAGHFEEDVELWDGEHNLVAVARQRAMLARSGDDVVVKV